MAPSVSSRARATPAGESATPVRQFPHRVPIALGRRLYLIGTAASAEVVEPEGLIPLEFATLTAIRELPGMDQNTLAASMVLDRTTMSSIVFELEQKGLIEREVNDADRRARKLRLSRAGLKLHDRLRPLAMAGQQRIFSVLSAAERETLIELLLRVIEGNPDYLRPGAGRRKRTRKPGAKPEKGRTP